MSDTPNRLAGTASLAVGGQTYALVGTFEYSPSTIKRTSLNGMDGVHGFKEEHIPGHIGGVLRDTGGLTVADFNAMDNVPLTVQLANGKTIVGRNMWTVESQDVNSDEATVPVRWEGPSVTEVLAA